MQPSPYDMEQAVPIQRARARPWTWPIALAVLWLLTFGIYAASISRVGVNTDALANSLSAWRIATTGNVWMDGLDLSESGQISHFRVGRNGHMITTATPGPKVAAAPFYLGSSKSQDEVNYFRGSLAAAFWTSIAMACLYGSLCGLVSRGRALSATAVVAFTTPVWSVSANALWTHPIDLLGLACSALALSKGRYWYAGAGFALGVLARPHVAAVAAVVGLWLAWRKKTPIPLFHIGIPTAAGLGLLAAWTAYNSGIWSPLGGYQANSSLSLVDESLPASLAVLGFFFSPSRGWIIWTPVMLIILPAIVRYWRDAPDWTKALAMGGIAYTALQIYSNPYGGDGFWGYRHALEGTLCLTPLGTVSAWKLSKKAKFALLGLICVQFSLIGLGSIFDRLIYLGPFYGNEWSYHSFWAAFEDEPGLIGTAAVGLMALAAAACWIVTLLRARSTRTDPLICDMTG